MKCIRDIIRARYAETETLFVFPSEIVAAFWRKEAMRITKSDVIDPSRFISWDRFKEDSFALFREQKPVNTVVRTLFAYSCLEKNKRTGSEFAGLIAPEYADNSMAFLQYISRILPSLNILYKADIRFGRDSSGFIAALRQLFHRYEEFLSRHNLFEPSFQQADPSHISKPVVIFFPEIIEDYTENADSLEDHPAITIIHLPKTAGVEKNFRLFSTTLHEYDWLFNRIIELLREGVSFYDIAVTYCSESDLNFFQNAAAKYPLTFVYRMGKAATEYAAGQFFLYLRDCVESDYHIEKIKMLFLLQGVPWKERRKLERIILKGINTCYIQEIDNTAGTIQRLKRGGEQDGDDDLVSYLFSLHRGITAIVKSNTMEELKKAIITFSLTFFDQTAWDETNRRVFEYIVNAITDIENTIRNMDLPAGLSPFMLFITQVQKSIYVPKKQKVGISVYPYRVSAGIAPRYHFVVSAHHGAVTVLSSSWDFLRKDYKKAFGIEDKDMSSDFIRAYLGSGENIIISCSSKTFSGPALIPGFFMENLPEPPAEEDVTVDINPYRGERSFWRIGVNGRSEQTDRHLTRIFPLQDRGLRAMANNLSRPLSKSYTTEPIIDETVREKILSRLKKDDTIAISTTSLERFTHCPFAYLLDAVIGKEEQKYEAYCIDSGIIGRFLHEVVRIYYSAIKNEDGFYDPAKMESYSRFLEKGIDEVGRKMYGRGYTFLPPVREELAGKARKWISNLGLLEAVHFQKAAILGLEREVKRKVTFGGTKKIILRGRIDRLSGAKDVAILIDYKTLCTITASDITGKDNLPPVSFQIPMYIYLSENNGISVARAGYISLSESKYIPVIKTQEDSRGRLTREEIDGCIETMHSYIEEMAGSMLKGYYPTREENCTPCGYRGICRMKYAISV